MVLDNSTITSNLQQHFPHDRTYCPETQTWVKAYPVSPSTTLSDVCRTFLARYHSQRQSTNFDGLDALIDTEVASLDGKEVDEAAVVAILSGAIFKIQFTKLRDHGIQQNHENLGQFVLNCSLQDIVDGQGDGLVQVLLHRAQGLKFYSNLTSLNNDSVVADLKLLSLILRICNDQNNLQEKIEFLSKKLFIDLSKFSNNASIFSRLIPSGDLAQRYKYAHICTLINEGIFLEDVVDIATQTCYCLDLLRLEENGKTRQSFTGFQRIDRRTVATVRDNLRGGGTELSTVYMLAGALNSVNQSASAYDLLQKYSYKKNFQLLDEHAFKIKMDVYLDAGKVDDALKLCQGKDLHVVAVGFHVILFRLLRAFKNLVRIISKSF